MEKRKRLLTSLAVFWLATAAQAAQQFEGTVESRIYDDFVSSKSRTQQFLIDETTRRTYKLRFRGANKPEFLTGSRVRLTGELDSGSLVVDTDAKASVQLISTATPSTDVHTIAVILVNFADASLSCSASSIGNAIFPDPAASGSNSCVSSFQLESAFGAVTFERDTDGDGLPDVFGPYTISATTSSVCDASGWADEADVLAAADGIDLSIYQHLLYVIPSSSTCTWGGVANIGCGVQCRAWVAYCNYPTLFAHELGHNLGMGHAASDTNNDGAVDDQYGDYSDPLGYPYVGWRHNNAPHKYQLGWFSGSPNAVVDVAQSGNYALGPLEISPQGSTYPQVLRVYKPGAVPYYYYVSYRIGAGYDSTLQSTYMNKISIHRMRADNMGGTYFIAALSDGQVFQDPSGFSVKLLSHTTDPTTAYAQAQISFGASPQAPTVAIAPGSVLTNSATGAVSMTVSVTDMDGTGSGSSTFSLSPSGPAGWTLSMNPAALTLAPNAAGTAVLTATPSSTAADATYALNVTASAPAHPSSAGSASVTLDTTAPAAPSGLAASAGTKGSVQLAWGAPAGAASYRLYRNTGGGYTLLTTTTATSYKDTNTKVSVNTTFYYYVVAVDTAGNASAASNTASILVKASTTGKR